MPIPPPPRTSSCASGMYLLGGFRPCRKFFNLSQSLPGPVFLFLSAIASDHVVLSRASFSFLGFLFVGLSRRTFFFLSTSLFFGSPPSRIAGRVSFTTGVFSPGSRQAADHPFIASSLRQVRRSQRAAFALSAGRLFFLRDPFLRPSTNGLFPPISLPFIFDFSSWIAFFTLFPLTFRRGFSYHAPDELARSQNRRVECLFRQANNKRLSRRRFFDSLIR